MGDDGMMVGELLAIPPPDAADEDPYAGLIEALLVDDEPTIQRLVNRTA